MAHTPSNRGNEPILPEEEQLFLEFQAYVRSIYQEATKNATDTLTRSVNQMQQLSTAISALQSKSNAIEKRIADSYNAMNSGISARFDQQLKNMQSESEKQNRSISGLKDYMSNEFHDLRAQIKMLLAVNLISGIVIIVLVNVLLWGK